MTKSLNRNVNFKNKFCFTSLGCARNLVDSEVMIGILLRAGYEAISEVEEADFLVVNTCGFLEASRQEAIDTLRSLFDQQKQGAKVIAAGCMVQKHRPLLEELFPQIHYFLGSGDIEKILEAVQAKSPGSAVTDARSYLEWGEVPRTLSTPSHYAYLKIAEGCKKRCAFCIIPTIKGPLRSKSVEQVIKEFRALRAQGVFEVILIAQDLGDFGKDRKEKGALAHLLREILKEEGHFWLRLLYLYPDEIDEELIAVMQSDPRLCPYLDRPIQHINNEILRAMHRTTSKEEILQILSSLRRQVPGVVIRTSLMVGFPGETEEQFQELLAFVHTAALDQVGIFTFSKEKEAYAARLPHQIEDAVKEERFQRLAAAQKEVVLAKHRSLIGRKLTAIVEGFHPESELLLRARHSGQCPDIDGQIVINDGRKVTAFGKLYEVEITDIAEYDLIGRVTKAMPHPSKLAIV